MKYLVPILLLVVVSCQKQRVANEVPPHIVSLEEIHKPDELPKVMLVGVAKKNGEKDSYHIEVNLPEGIAISNKLNSEIKVKLPIIHNQFVTGQLIKKDQDTVTILLKKQVQELNAQKIEVSLTLERDDLYIVPFTSVSSPRGIREKIFVMNNERAREVEVKVISPVDSNRVLIFAKIQNENMVVVNGINNLVDNDKIKEEKNL